MMSANDYFVLRGDAEVIEADGHGEKVLRLRDGS
ncbi:MAG TPA: toluene tolerance protein, partial [Pseudomonadales bacterium]|nr:toluene tolerance protein [Pseudomonadales bacterium]